MAKRTRHRHGVSPGRHALGEPQLPEETVVDASALEGAEDSEKLEELEKPEDLEKPKEPEKSEKSVEPDEPRKKKKRRSRGGVRCPVCGHSGEPTGDAGRVRCGTCGAVFPSARPALGEVAKAREKRFSRAFALPNSEERLQAKTHAGEVMRGFFQVLKGRPVALNAFGKNVLEVNCGLGFRLRAFQSYGWTVEATETSATAYEYAHRQSLEVTRGWLAEGRFGKTRFDLALFCGSFGEMDDPHKAAKELKELLVERGLVCVLREPLASEDASPPDDSRLFVHTPESVKRSFTKNKFSLVSEDIVENVGTFWFRAKTRRRK